MNETDLLFFPENNQKEFDFNTLLGNKDYATISGISVSIDRIIRDITQTTVIALSGTVIIKGVKMRGVWDVYGNIIEFKQIFSLFIPKKCDVRSLFIGYNKEIFRLVNVILKKED